MVSISPFSPTSASTTRTTVTKARPYCSRRERQGDGDAATGVRERRRSGSGDSGGMAGDGSLVQCFRPIASPALPCGHIHDPIPAESDYVLVLTTLPADADAATFAAALVEARLAACVNLLPVMQSVYRWQGAVEQESERQMVIKTSRLRLNALWERVRDLHPYEVPEFIVLPIVDGSDAYLTWLGDSI